MSAHEKPINNTAQIRRFPRDENDNMYDTFLSGSLPLLTVVLWYILLPCYRLRDFTRRYSNT